MSIGRLDGVGVGNEMLPLRSARIGNVHGLRTGNEIRLLMSLFGLACLDTHGQDLVYRLPEVGETRTLYCPPGAYMSQADT